MDDRPMASLDLGGHVLETWRLTPKTRRRARRKARENGGYRNLLGPSVLTVMVRKRPGGRFDMIQAAFVPTLWPCEQRLATGPVLEPCN